jgi:hypothetical protein
MPKDDKDWTWVLERPCPECAFDSSAADAHDVAGLLRVNAAEWRPLLADPRVAARPSEHVWSALEYGCHVRDVFGVYDGRLRRMLTEEDPLYPNWDQDQTALDDHYAEQSPSAVAEELTAAAEHLAARFDGVLDDQWQRTGRRSDGASFTVDTFARYFIHDPIHHLHDVRTGYAQMAAINE